MQRPNALGLFLCDQVIVDRDSGRRTLVGLFHVLTCDELPFTSPPFAVYAALTDGQGRMRIQLVVTDIDTDEQLVQDSVEVNFDDPLAVFHARFAFSAFTFPAAGQYLFEMHADDQSICHRRLTIELNEEVP